MTDSILSKYDLENYIKDLHSLAVNKSNVENVITILQKQNPKNNMYNTLTFDTYNMPVSSILYLIHMYKQILNNNINSEKDTKNTLTEPNTQLKKLLIVDDDILSIELIKDLVESFNKKNIIIDYITDIDIFSTNMCDIINQVDLLLLDIHFGHSKENGINILKKIREHEIQNNISYWYNDKVETTNRSLKIIILTTDTDKETYKVSIQYGAKFVNKILMTQNYVKTMLRMFLT